MNLSFKIIFRFSKDTSETEKCSYVVKMFIYGWGFYKKKTTTIFFSPVFTNYQENMVEKMRGSNYLDRLYYGSHKKALNRGTS